MIDIKSKIKELDSMPRKDFIKKIGTIGIGVAILSLISPSTFASVWFRNTNSVQIDMNEIRGITNGTINRTGDLVSSIVINGRTITINRDIDNNITGYQDSDYEWTLTRDIDNNITEWSVN